MTEDKCSKKKFQIRLDHRTFVSFMAGVIVTAVTVIAVTEFRTFFDVSYSFRPEIAIVTAQGMAFGIPGALGSMVGNAIVMLMNGRELMYTLFRSLQWFCLCALPYFLWMKLNKGRKGEEFRLDRFSRVLKFCGVILVVSVVSVLINAAAIGLYNLSASIVGTISMFDYGIMIGIVLLPLFYEVRRKLGIIDENKKVVFHLNERIIFFVFLIAIILVISANSWIYFMYTIDEEITSDWWHVLNTYQRNGIRLYLILAMIVIRLLEKRFIRPIDRLVYITGKYYDKSVDDTMREKLAEDYKSLANAKTDVGKLAGAYVRMTENLKNYIENLKTLTTEKGRIDAELEFASEIQAQMLPRIFPAFPEHEEFDLYASMTPAKEVGGDFYDFFMIGENHLAIVIADVSGKGVPAAMFMALSKALIKNYARTQIDVNEVFDSANQVLCEGNEAGLFVTAWFGILDLRNGKLSYVNAGHNPPLLRKRGKGFDYVRKRSGFILAGMEDTIYRKNEMYLDPGDRLFLYTDGVTEATNTGEELYGEERLQKYLNSHMDDTAFEMINGLKKDINLFVGEAPQFDDITMLMLDFYQVDEEKRVAERQFSADREALQDVLEFAEKAFKEGSCPIKVSLQILMVIEELFLNVVDRACQRKGGRVRISINCNGKFVKESSGDEKRAIIICLIDGGIPFNPLIDSVVDFDHLMEDDEMKGFGIFLMKKIMDHVSYSYENEENILTMIKIRE